jgi:hypothetical protein
MYPYFGLFPGHHTVPPIYPSAFFAHQQLLLPTPILVFDTRSPIRLYSSNMNNNSKTPSPPQGQDRPSTSRGTTRRDSDDWTIEQLARFNNGEPVPEWNDETPAQRTKRIEKTEAEEEQSVKDVFDLHSDALKLGAVEPSLKLTMSSTGQPNFEVHRPDARRKYIPMIAHGERSIGPFQRGNSNFEDLAKSALAFSGGKEIDQDLIAMGISPTRTGKKNTAAASASTADDVGNTAYTKSTKHAPSLDEGESWNDNSDGSAPIDSAERTEDQTTQAIGGYGTKDTPRSRGIKRTATDAELTTMSQPRRRRIESGTSTSMPQPPVNPAHIASTSAAPRLIQPSTDGSLIVSFRFTRPLFREALHSWPRSLPRHR